jgi:hypothetical protein
LDDDMAFVFDGGVCVFWVFCCWLSLAVWSSSIAIE